MATATASTSTSSLHADTSSGAPGAVRSSLTLQLETQLTFFDKHVVGGPSAHLNVLEIGCGSVPHLAVALHARGHHVTGIDPSLTELSLKAGNETLRLVKSDFIEWDHEQHLQKHQHQYFDVVLFTKSLHHIPDVDNALVKAWSLVKPQNGLLLIEEFAREAINEVTATWVFGTYDSFRAAGFTKRKTHHPWDKTDVDGSVHHHHSGSHHEHHHSSGSHHDHHHHHSHRPDDESVDSLPPIERWRMVTYKDTINEKRWVLTIGVSFYKNHVHNPPLHTASRIREGLKRLLMDMGGGKEEEEVYFIHASLQSTQLTLSLQYRKSLICTTISLICLKILKVMKI